MKSSKFANHLILAAALLAPALATNARAVEPAQMPLPAASPRAAAPSVATLTPAETKIAAARKMIEQQPDKAEHYNNLALALTRRARETANPNYYVEAEDTLAKSLEVEPNNFTARKLRVWALLGRHEFAQALDAAKALNKETPDDILVYGYLADANIELGNYDDAEKAAQWMLDMRPGNVPGLTRAAYLRELFGDIEGSLDFMIKSYERTPWQEKEDRAWLLTHIAHLEMSRGKLEAGETAVMAALELYPDYHYALGQLGKLRAAQGRLEEAVSAFERLVQVAPNPENFFPLAEAQKRAGMKARAQSAFAEFEQKALKEVEIWDNANRELIFYYADHASDPVAALRIARKEAARRQDIFTLDALAWALHKSGDHKEARVQIERALAVGIRDAKLFYHAGAIAAAQDDLAAARSYFSRSLELNPHSESAGMVRAALNGMRPVGADVASLIAK